jgi:hypothetical protein
LGDSTSSVESDRVVVRATVRQISHSAYTVHELTTAAQGTVREYVSPAGQVFAVSWHGPAKPNLRQILGANYDVLAASKHQHSGGHNHLAITEGRLVFESNGHMRSFHGRAYLSDAIPSGVTADEIK